MKYKILFLVFTVVASSLTAAAQRLPYKDPAVNVEERVEDLLSLMTLKEKFWQLFMIPGDLSDGKEKYMDGIFGLQVSTVAREANVSQQMMEYGHAGTAQKMAVTINEIQKFFVEESRLGIPIIAFDEALHGLIRGGATAFPQAIALAATWDTSLVSEVAHAITMETKSRGIRQILSPVLDLARDVRWGRVEETYGEDPYLATQRKEFSGNESIIVSCTVRNSGKAPGDEVVQLYIRDELSSVSRPVKELRGFQRITLLPGEEKTISFTLGHQEFSMLNKEMERVVEPGTFRIMIGASSSDIRLRGIVTAL
ncbi:MAG: fibronectin type III-like domain-contianing protein [Bacteroidales bacterium]